ncbi:MAG: MOSC domain-containing protein [Candidatus Binataceae bacterium]
MRRRQIGQVSALWRYPVKSMRGEPLSEAMITENGTLGDRAWALRELKYGGIMSARTWAAMLALRARYRDEPGASASGTVVIDLPDGNSLRADDPAAAQVLSSLFRREVKLEQIRAARLSPEELEAVVTGTMFPPNRDFFDEDVIHILATGTLAHLRRLHGPSDFDPRRFRANICVDTGDDGASGFVEDQWLGGMLEIGATARIAGIRPALRCAMTTHPQWNLPHDPAILRTAWEHHEAYVGVFASVAMPGTVGIGDPVMLTS